MNEKYGMKMDEKDLVGVVLAAANKDETIPLFSCDHEKLGEILVREKIPAGHKVALQQIKKGQKVIKYGMEIGAATQDIVKGVFGRCR